MHPKKYQAYKEFAPTLQKEKLENITAYYQPIGIIKVMIFVII